MPPIVDLKKVAFALEDACRSGNQKEIEKAQVDFLFECGNYFEIAINYVTLEQMGFHFDFGSSVIPKGTRLYRIRKFEDGVDFSDASQWAPPPSHPQNRANHEGQEALYLSSLEDTCILETHLQYGDRYVLGTYECLEDIEVGGFFQPKIKDQRLIWAGVALNALLIAPSRGKSNTDLFNLLDIKFGKIRPDDIQFEDVSTRHNFVLPFKFAVMNQRDELYEITNQLCDIIRSKYPLGIRYSSCFIPLETLYITSNAYNVVLYTEGLSKIRLLSHELKTNDKKDYNSTMMANIVLNVERKANDQT